MPVFKCTYLFDTGIRADGWSETWYLTAADLTGAIASSQALAPARVNLLNNGYVLRYVRVTPNIPVLPKPARRVRKAGLFLLNLQGTASSTSAPGAQTAELPWMAALIRLSSTDFSIFRIWLLRGINDNSWSANTDKQAVAFFNLALPKFLTALKAAGAVIENLVTLRAGGNPPIIANIQYERLTRRATGRPFALDRGRR